ncbi:hypothetical protein [Frankia sp. Cas4]|uniref:hypothetical protein n=1 Tax=Frankia sp. Cas4 TaxID=3073927 RepID=UPI002AD49C7C|nr:hypothetical protein [Frankia sp. Cas4]
MVGIGPANTELHATTDAPSELVGLENLKHDASVGGDTRHLNQCPNIGAMYAKRVVYLLADDDDALAGGRETKESMVLALSLETFYLLPAPNQATAYNACQYPDRDINYDR